jgi:hypothetical protein
MTASASETSTPNLTSDQQKALAAYPNIRPKDLGLLSDFLFFMG